MPHAEPLPVLFLDGPGAHSAAGALVQERLDGGAAHLETFTEADFRWQAADADTAGWTYATAAALLYASQLTRCARVRPRRGLMVIAGPPAPGAESLWSRVNARFIAEAGGSQSAHPSSVDTPEARALSGAAQLDETIAHCISHGRPASVEDLVERQLEAFDRAGVAAEDPRRGKWLAKWTMARESTIDGLLASIRVAEGHGWEQARVDLQLTLASLYRARRQHTQYSALVTQLAGLVDDMPIGLRARILLLQCGRHERVGDYDVADGLASRARQLADTEESADAFALAVRTQARIARVRGQLDSAARLFDEHGDHASREVVEYANLLLEHAMTLLSLDRQTEARHCVSEALELAGYSGDYRTASRALTVLGEIARQAGELDRAASLYERAAAISSDDPYALANLAQVHALQGAHQAAIDRADELLKHSEARLVALPLKAILAPSAIEVGDPRAPSFLLIMEDVLSIGLAVRDVLDAAERGAQMVDDSRAARFCRVMLGESELLGDPAAARRAMTRLTELRDAGCPIPLGQFDVFEPIAAGGMAQVWRGVHRRSGLPVAIKVLKRWSSPDAAERFEHEVRAVVGLEHPNVVTVLDVGAIDRVACFLSGDRMVDGGAYLAMELVEGGTLRQSLGRVSWSRCLRILRGILAGLAHAHAHGIIHRDLKPDNVLLPGESDPNAGVRLADFGVAATLRRELDVSGGTSGTPAYMAPEQFQGRRSGPWTDLYALGCLTTALVQGSPPYEAKDVHAFAAAHVQHPVPQLVQVIAVPEGLDAWVARLLQKRPADRFAFAADALAALDELGPATRSPAAAALGESRAASTVSLTDVFALPSVLQAEPSGRPVSRAPRRLALPDRWPAESVPSPRVRSARLVEQRRTPSVGRDAERQQLWGALRSAHDGVGQAVAVLGEPGIGRTRLWKDLAIAAHKLGAARVVHCENQSVQAAVATAVGLPDDPVAAHHRILDLTGDRALAERLSADFDARAAAELLGALARERTVVFAGIGRCPGLQVAASFALGQPSRVLWVFVPSQGEPPPAVDGLQEVRLRALERNQTVRMLMSGLGLHREMAHFIAARCWGNPGLALRLVRHHAPLLLPFPGGLRIQDGLVPAPLTERDSEDDQRLDTLIAGDTTAEAALQLVAMLGPELTGVQWSAICERTQLSAPERLVERLVAEGLALREETGWRLNGAILRHALLCRGVASGSERKLARFAADHCEEPLQKGLLLHHAGASGEALGPLIEGVTRLIRTDAYMEAYQHSLTLGECGVALALDPADPRWRLSLELRAIAALKVGRLEEAASEFGRLVEAWPEDHASRYRLCLAMRLQGQAEASTEILLEMLARGRVCEDGLVADEAAVLAAIGLNHLERRDLGQAVEWLERARRRLEACPDPVRAARLDLQIAACLVDADRIDEAEPLLLEAERVFVRHGELRSAAAALQHLGAVSEARGDQVKALERFRHTLELYEETGSDGIVHSLFRIGRLLLDRGDIDGARRRLSQAVESAAEVGRWTLWAESMVWLLRASAEDSASVWDQLIRSFAHGAVPEGSLDRTVFEPLIEAAAERAEQLGRPGRAQQLRALWMSRFGSS